MTGEMLKDSYADYKKQHNNMEGEKEIQKFEIQEEIEGAELLSEKALEDDFELDEDLERLPI